MRVLFDVGHPAQVHLIKKTVFVLQEHGYEIDVAVRERENIVSGLLEHYGIDYEKIEPNAPGMAAKALSLVKNDLDLLKMSKKKNYDIFVGMGSPYSAHASRIRSKPYISFSDTEDARLQLKLTLPFTDSFLTPDCFLTDFSPKKHIKYPSYHELAYLHPREFSPDDSVFEHLDVEKGEPYVIMRFSAWDASHDTGQHGFRDDTERYEVVKNMEKYGKVLISSEIPLKGKLERFRIKIPSHMMHDALYYASLYVGDGHKMAAESGILGTPSILVSTRWDRTGNFMDFVKKYRTVEAFKEPAKALSRAVEIMKESKIYRKEWVKKANNLIEKKMDMTEFMTYFIEKYPESHRKIIAGENSFNKFIYKNARWNKDY